MKNLSILIIILLMLSQFSLNAVSETEKGILYVDDNNTSGPWDGSLNHPYQHIQDALNISSDGDTVFVFNGTYTELVTIEKQVVLIGENNSKTILQDIITDNYQIPELLTISADNVTVENLFLRQHNNTNIQHHMTGIYCIESEGIRIHNNQIIDCTRSVEVRNSSAEISDNQIFSSQRVGQEGIYFFNPTPESDLIVSNNTIINYDCGVYFHCHRSAPSQMLIDYNHIESSIEGQEESEGYGIRFYFAADQDYQMRLSYNIITGFLVGFYYKDLWCGGPILEDTSVDIFSNSFDNIDNDLRFSPNPLRSDEKITITKNNFYGQNNSQLFLDLIILDPSAYTDYTGMIHKSSIEWSKNYWANHSATRPVWIPGKLMFLLSISLPVYVLKLPIYQKDFDPADEPFEV